MSALDVPAAGRRAHRRAWRDGRPLHGHTPADGVHGRADRRRRDVRSGRPRRCARNARDRPARSREHGPAGARRPARRRQRVRPGRGRGRDASPGGAGPRLTQPVPPSCPSCRRPSCSTWPWATCASGRTRARATRRRAPATTGPVAEGSVGAGAGATVGKLWGMEHAMKGGVGTASIRLPDGLVVAALVAVNAVGDVVDPSDGRVVAGAQVGGWARLAGLPAGAACR